MDISTLGVGFGLGMIVSFIVTFVYLLPKVDARLSNRVEKQGKKIVSVALALLMVGIFLAGQVAITLAQTAVPLEIPTDVIFTEANNWISTFAPIAAIGIGITIALAVLGYIGKMIASAFKA
jgi:response regulator of citrate/malate metabolism